MTDDEIEQRFREIWVYCMMDHKVATLMSGPCNECIARYTLTGVPDAH